MTADEHIKKAEALLELAEKADPASATLLVARAQVHATLAQAQPRTAVRLPNGQLQMKGADPRPGTVPRS